MLKHNRPLCFGNYFSKIIFSEKKKKAKKKTQSCLSIHRFIFLGLITCLSGSSYFFIIAVIIILRRQFHKPQQENDGRSITPARQIELHTLPKCTEEKPSTSQNPKVMPEVCARAVANQDDGADVNGMRLLAKVTKGNATQTTAEIVSCHNGVVDLETSEFKCTVQAKQVDKDKVDHQKDDMREEKVEA